MLFLQNTLLNSLHWGKPIPLVAVEMFGSGGKKPQMDNVSLQQMFNRIPLLKYRYRVSFPSDYVPTLDNQNFSIKKTQPSKMQREHWIMIANSCQKNVFQTLLFVKTSVSSINVRLDDASTITFQSQRLRFLQYKWNFSSPQIPTRRKYWKPRFNCTLIH